jgi:hypothetical protein
MTISHLPAVRAIRQGDDSNTPVGQQGCFSAEKHAAAAVPDNSISLRISLNKPY